MEKQQPIYLFGNPILREICKPVDFETTTEEERKLLADQLIITMLRHKAAGLAAPQIGIAKRVFCVSINDKTPTVFFNPEMKDHEEEIIKMNEGCLSFPNIVAKMNCRWDTVYIEGVDYKGTPLRIELSGIESVATQHELAHLNGDLIIDNVGGPQRLYIKTKIKTFRRKLSKSPIYKKGQSAFRL